MQHETSLNSWLEKPIFKKIPKVNTEFILIVVILLVALFSRFYLLDVRTMAHDEINHVTPGYDLYTGLGYQHSPMTHGPFQMHLLAFTYFLLGDSDFSSRLPAAVFSITAICFVLFGFRRYLGRIGALIAAIYFTISPFLLYYGRYTRNEGFIELFGVLQLYAILRYLETGKQKSLYLLTLAVCLHFITKETAFIYTAQMLLFLAILFIVQLLKSKQQINSPIWKLIVAPILAVAGLGIAFVASHLIKQASAADSGVAPSWTSQPLDGIGLSPLQFGVIIGFLMFLVALVFTTMYFKRSILPEARLVHRSLDMLILIGSLVLPMLVAFPVNMMGWNAMDYSNIGKIQTAAALIPICISAILLGILWETIFWLKNAAIFYGIFTIFYTTFFTNGNGFFTGLLGGLGYWLEQQGVNRGGQPWYYYTAVQIPMYEYLGIAGLVIALYFGTRYLRFSTAAGFSPARQPEDIGSLSEVEKPERPKEAPESTLNLVEKPLRIPVLWLLVFWCLTSILAFTIAGEKMPWLTVHIALPLALICGWGFGFLIESTDWAKLNWVRTGLGILLMPLFIFSLNGAVGILLGVNPPFAGKTLEQLQATNSFIFAVAFLIASILGMIFFFRKTRFSIVIRLVTLFILSVLGVLTIRTSIRANFIDYDNGKEFLYYAHAPSGPKEILAQIEEISHRTTSGLDIKVAYDNEARYPYWWYLRGYANRYDFDVSPTRELLNYPIVVVGESNYSKVDALLADEYVSFEYLRMVWPMQDYYGLSWERVKNAITDPAMRNAIWQIWLNRDYSSYAALSGSTSLTPESWSPANKMKMYIRRDVVSLIWNYGVAAATSFESEVDPYSVNVLEFNPKLFLGEELGLNAPRSMTVARDGTIYLVDSRNHRIVHIERDGSLINSWGTYANAAEGDAPGGTFNEPWGIAIGKDGSVFVADTWNHRIQKFDSSGKFIAMWGSFGQDGSPSAFYGPRGLAIDMNGNVLVTDTGNKRVVVFDSRGRYISEFGTLGMGLGQFDEPVGIAVDTDGRIFVADTWNRRIQVFQADELGKNYLFVTSWDISGWESTTTENKPFISLDGEGHLFVVDPESYRVLEFTVEGVYLRSWGQYSPNADGFGMPSGITALKNGEVWISDAGNQRIFHFTLPALPEEVIDLPEFPFGAEELVYDAFQRALVNEQHEPVYLLDPEKFTWFPSIPASIGEQILADVLPVEELLRTWVLYGPDGQLLYRWDTDKKEWVMIGPEISESPDEPIINIITVHQLAAEETLSDVALRYYGNASEDYWMVIYSYNKDLIGEDPGVVYPGMDLIIPVIPDTP